MIINMGVLKFQLVHSVIYSVNPYSLTTKRILLNFIEFTNKNDINNCSP